MSKHLNSASRLYRILQQGAALPDNTATLKAWASLFHMEEPYGVKLSIDVSERLLWLNQELEILEQQLRDSSSEEESHAEALAHTGQALSPVYLPTNWGNVKQFLSAETLDSLASWIEILPEDETPLRQEELVAIRAQAEELESLLSSSTLDEKLKLLVSKHIESIRKALAGYSIVGVRALKTGAFSALGELIYVEQTIKENCDKPEVHKVIGVWEKIGQLANSATMEEGPAKTSKNPWMGFCHPSR